MPRKLPANKLDALTEEQRALILDRSDGVNGQAKHTLAALVSLIRNTHGIEMSDTRLSEWLARRRRDGEFEKFLGKVRVANSNAAAIVAEVEKNSDINRANVALLSSALQAAVLADDQEGQERCSRLLAMVLAAHTGEKKADAAIEAARAATLRAEADFPVKFLKWLEDRDAMKIARSNVSHAEKIERLRARFFEDVDRMDAAGEVALP